MKDKPRYELAHARRIADSLVELLAPHVERIIIAGSIRREKETVGDIEILYIPRFKEEADDLFTTRQRNTTDDVIDDLIERNYLTKRKNVIGSHIWGDKNKLARHVESGIPVDLFSTSDECWYNYLVCRTGPSDLNTLNCHHSQAQRISMESVWRGVHQN